MKAGEHWDLTGVGDRELAERLTQLLATGGRTEARIIAHLAAVEDRRLHLRSGSSSLFDYCVNRLGLSNSEAFHRITAARLAARFPVIFSLIESRALHLSAVCMLRDYLAHENHVELLTAASHKTKWQIEELLAQHFPRPAVPATIRKLPSTRAPALSSEHMQAPPTPAQTLTTTPAQLPPPFAPARPRQRLEPAAEARYRLQLDVSASLRKKLDRARDLLSHAVPDRDIATVLERALDELLVKVERQRFAQTKSQRRAQSAVLRVRSRTAEPPHRREHVANATRRELVARDGLQCSFVSDGGHRCTATSLLQIHHEVPWARGGASNEGNLRILCAAHNGLLAERDFGRAHIKARRAARNAVPEIREEAAGRERAVRSETSG